MHSNEVRVSDISFDEEMGSARLIFEGYIPYAGEVDDPVVELFRPIRVKYVEEIFFTVIVNHYHDTLVCTLLPSNRRGRTQEELARVAKKALQGDSTDSGIVSKYRDIIEQFSQDEDGLKAYLEKIKAIGDAANEDEKTILINECNDGIKAFVAKLGLEMPSQRKKREQIKAQMQKR